ncbi:MAG: glycosyltransferase family 4 protein [Armatimonadetes bacterium]|nr:glycosyltransferase family 4 protein [Armatimonadota bacterium]
MSLSVLQVAAGMPNWGGAELHLLTLSDQLRQRGYDVTVACWPGRWVERRAQEMGLPTVPVATESAHDRRDMGRLYQFLRDNKIDVLHAHSPNDFIIPPLAAIRAGVAVRIMTRHLPHSLRRRRDAWVYSNFFFSRIVAVSESVRRTLIGSGMNPSRVETIHHGTDVEAFTQTSMTPAESRSQLGIPADVLGVGIVGRISEEKGHHVLLQAAESLSGRYPLRLVIIGDGPDEAAIKQMAHDIGIADRVIFTGFRDDVNNAINALDIVVSASTWDEPCSAVVQQAMALCKPVIGTRAGGTPEMIVEGQTGLLVPPSDAGALAEALARLAGDAFLRKRLGAAGRLRVEACFSLRGMMDKIEELYRREYERSHGPQALREATAA